MTAQPKAVLSEEELEALAGRPFYDAEGFVQRLRDITYKCRPDMHEPDEQGVLAEVIGNHLDNAMGSVGEPKNCGEYVVEIESDAGGIERFNLASLIAVARLYNPDILRTALALTEKVEALKARVAELESYQIHTSLGTITVKDSLNVRARMEARQALGADK